MKINFAEREKTVTFKDLEVGDAFVFASETDTLAIKTEEVYDREGVDGLSYNAYSLTNNEFLDIPNLVKVIRADLVVTAKV